MSQDKRTTVMSRQDTVEVEIVQEEDGSEHLEVHLLNADVTIQVDAGWAHDVNGIGWDVEGGHIVIDADGWRVEGSKVVRA